MRTLILFLAVLCSFPSSAKSVQKYYKEHQPKRCETLNRTLTHVNKLLSFSEGKEYKERLKEKKALKKLRKEKGC
ncbi:hypothetical protein [Aliivibrio fischeri]|uniref:Uncharacterized protein n=1 Tax=Aliivibrio fischeri TaxID=668 RepID=A0A510UG07_ALIFS|nr:hypothetical protein [Aliivibrio fischeri]MUK50692.1 hypothetical protein [Aliivibrio fischeri]MUK67650.1 hypothetical protein [Aliivibrio fischeri]GEK13568.1 hypothetical protein AFI02nite_16040 [Aliivibrio fischeri]